MRDSDELGLASQVAKLVEHNGKEEVAKSLRNLADQITKPAKKSYRVKKVQDEDEDE